MLDNYILEKSVFSDDEFLTVYGTSKYEHIWEEMCACVFDNKLDDNLNKRVSSKIRSKKNQKLYEMERGPRSPFHNRDANYMRFFSWVIHFAIGE